jgi:hypothetical protein
MLLTVEQENTRQTINEVADRSKFLRRVIREDGWKLDARESDDWKIVFSRKIAGKPGQPDVTMRVELEDTLALRGNWGNHQAFSDAETVCIPKPTHAYLSYGDVAIVAKLLLDGSKLFILGSAGSTNSSKLGLSFVAIHASMPKVSHGSITIGTHTVYAKGRQIISGAVGNAGRL